MLVRFVRFGRKVFVTLVQCHDENIAQRLGWTQFLLWSLYGHDALQFLYRRGRIGIKLDNGIIVNCDSVEKIFFVCHAHELFHRCFCGFNIFHCVDNSCLQIEVEAGVALIFVFGRSFNDVSNGPKRHVILFQMITAQCDVICDDAPVINCLGNIVLFQSGYVVFVAEMNSSKRQYCINILLIALCQGCHSFRQKTLLHLCLCLQQFHLLEEWRGWRDCRRSRCSRCVNI
mmetsp:Transcript_6005/g.10029  ORF Transcript_6005/g.10029 Transcript_6005/m.10029 type:complete len:230 (-) Transcript_6005:563-1252(-)